VGGRLEKRELMLRGWPINRRLLYSSLRSGVDRRLVSNADFLSKVQHNLTVTAHLDKPCQISLYSI
jgi:hypothetical protein